MRLKCAECAKLVPIRPYISGNRYAIFSACLTVERETNPAIRATMVETIAKNATLLGKKWLIKQHKNAISYSVWKERGLL